MANKIVAPAGKGYFYYNLLAIQQLFGESGLSMAGVLADLQQHKLDYAIVTMMLNGYGYNLRRLTPKLPQPLIDDLLPAFVDTCRSVGTEPWGHIGMSTWERDSPVAAAKYAAERANWLGLNGVVVNAEAAFKDNVIGGKPAPSFSSRSNSARLYMRTLRENFGGSIWFSSYRFPKLHPELPWAAFLDPQYCSGAMPQVYWVLTRDPVGQLARSIAEYRQITNLPLSPTGAAYTEERPEYRYNGGTGELWMPTPAEVRAFHQACIESKMVGASWWSRWDMRRVGLENALAGLSWPKDGEEVDIPADPSFVARLEKLEAWARGQGAEL